MRSCELARRRERGREPRRVDAFEAAAGAVLRLCSIRADKADAAWRAWDAAPRKLVRRARGSHWHAVLAEAPVHVIHRGAEVLGFAPRPVSETPAALRRLQVEGTALHDRDGLESPVGSQPAVLWLNPQLEITAGKAMAQVGHGAVELWDALDGPGRAAWVRHGLGVAVRVPAAGQWERLASTSSRQVRDGGLTEIPRGTVTVIPDWLL